MEEIIFETALNLVLTEDEKITIQYPFLPRLNDEIIDADKKKSSVMDRYIEKEGDNVYLLVFLKKVDSGENWQTRFELPA